MELLSAKHPGIPPTLRDDRLSEEVTPNVSVSTAATFCIVKFSFLGLFFFRPVQAEQLRQHYMTKYDSEVADAHQALQPVLQNIKEMKRKVSAIRERLCFTKTLSFVTLSAVSDLKKKDKKESNIVSLNTKLFNQIIAFHLKYIS